MQLSRSVSCFFAAFTLSFSPFSSFAASVTAPTDYVAISAGAFAIDRFEGDSSGQIGLEYRAPEMQYGLLPVVGATLDSDGGIYGYAGLNWNLDLGYRFWLIPNFVAGLYHEGDSKDLGGAIEFRSGIELDYVFDQGNRLGVTFNHISNASIYDKNPGAESILMVYSHPVNLLK